MLPSTRTSAASHRALPLKGRPILAFLWALVGAFKAGKTFIARNTGFGGVYRVRQISLVERQAGTRVDERRRLKWRMVLWIGGPAPPLPSPALKAALQNARPHVVLFAPFQAR